MSERTDGIHMEFVVEFLIGNIDYHRGSYKTMEACYSLSSVNNSILDASSYCLEISERIVLY